MPTQTVHRPDRIKANAMLDGHTIEFQTPGEKFAWLAEKWLDSQGGRSRLDFSHPAYLQIIGMGPIAVPLLLNEIEQRSGNWFEALRSIAGTSPVPAEIRGDFEAARSHWLKWGAENGYAQVENGKGNMDATAPA